MTKSIMLVGVGGQGTLLASRILGSVLLSQGYDVKVSEVHGMSQRGGSVVTYIKYGEKIYSPVIEKGEADIIVAFEQLEAARWLSYLKKDGVIVTSSQHIMPMPVITGSAVYPEDITEKLKKAGVKVVCADAMAIAEKAGNAKAANVALIGVLSKYLGLDDDVLDKALKMSVPAKLIEVNKRAYALGREQA